jgi:hypothetical protein
MSRPPELVKMDRESRRERRERLRRRARRQRMLVLGAVGCAAIAAAVLSLLPSHNAAQIARRPSRQRTSPSQLPGGGRSILPNHRVVALYGAPEDPQLGALGVGSPADAGRQLLAQAAAYEQLSPRRPVMPAFELLASIAQAAPGASGAYRMRQPASVIASYLTEARRIHALLILDVQPGRSPFMTEVRALHRWLVLPDVSLALDPEWSMGPGQVPGQEIGSTTSAVVNQVGSYLSGIVRAHGLPQKLLIVHRFTEGMIERPQALRTYPGVALALNVDGWGLQAAKISKYELFAHRRPGIYNGFKLFYRQDVGLMSPQQVLDLEPAPDVVIYQ